MESSLPKRNYRSHAFFISVTSYFSPLVINLPGVLRPKNWFLFPTRPQPHHTRPQPSPWPSKRGRVTGCHELCVRFAKYPNWVANNTAYFSPCSVSFVLSGEYIQYSPLINFRLIIPSNIHLQLIIPSNIHLQLIIPSNIHLQCLCSTKNEKKTTSRRQFGTENYFYSESLTQPRNVKNKYVILRHLGDMCLFTSALRASVNKSHIPSLPQNNLYLSRSTCKPCRLPPKIMRWKRKGQELG